jgi:hypothetical protein
MYKKKEARATWPRPLFFQFPSDETTWLDDADDDGAEEREHCARCDQAELLSHAGLLAFRMSQLWRILSQAPRIIDAAAQQSASGLAVSC